MVEELTTLAADGSSLSVAYFYCSIGNIASQSSENIFGSLVAQLSASNPPILNPIRDIYNQTTGSQAHRPPIKIGVLEESIIQCSSGGKQIIILLDAVNESQHMDDIERSLLRVASLSRNIRVVMTTTATMVLARHVDVLRVNINAEMMRGDIAAFIETRLEEDDVLRNLPSAFKADIADTLLYNADGSSVC